LRRSNSSFLKPNAHGDAQLTFLRIRRIGRLGIWYREAMARMFTERI